MSVMVGVLLAHLVGDYLLQSDWMAAEKTKRWWPPVAWPGVGTGVGRGRRY
jgi:hypothetical protein